MGLVSESQEISRLVELDPALLEQLAAYGSESLADAALDEWMLPVVARFGFLFVTRVAGEIAGSAQIIRCLEEGDLYMDIFYIRPAFRGRGYGSRFLAGILEQLPRERFLRLLVTVDPRNSRGMSLFEAAGFSEVDRLDDYYGYGRHRLLMAASLIEAGSA